MIQRLQRIVAVRAIQGASGAMHFNITIRPSIHFTAGTRTGGTNALTVRHRNASTSADPKAPSGHTLMQRPHPVHAKTSFFPSIVSVLRVFLGMARSHDTAQQQPRAETGIEKNSIFSN